MSNPDPLTPREADLQDFSFMPLHVARLRDSDLAAEESAEACWYALRLWAASWHQIPAGSLPNKETVLCNLAGLGRDMRTWRKFRDGALRGFVLCSDGRLYHPVVAENVLEAWIEKLLQRISSGAGNARRWGADFDAQEIDAQVDHAAALLRALDPESRTFAKLRRRQSRALPTGNAGALPVGSQETGTGTGTGTGINIDEEERAEKSKTVESVLAPIAPPPPAVPSPGAGLDVQLAHICDRAGIALDPSRRRWAEELKRVKGWLEKGFDMEADILPAVDRALARLPVDDTLGSLVPVDRELIGRKARTRQMTEAAKPALAPIVEKPGEGDQIGDLRGRIMQTIGIAQYRSWLDAASLRLTDDATLLIIAPNAFQVAHIEREFAGRIEQIARDMLGARMVRVTDRKEAA